MSVSSGAELGKTQDVESERRRRLKRAIRYAITGLGAAAIFMTSTGGAEASNDGPGGGNLPVETGSPSSVYFSPKELGAFLMAVDKNERFNSVGDSVSRISARWDAYQHYLWKVTQNRAGSNLSRDERIILETLLEKINSDSFYVLQLLKIASPETYNVIQQQIVEMPNILDISLDDPTLEGISPDFATYALVNRFGPNNLADYLNHIYAGDGGGNVSVEVASMLTSLEDDRLASPRQFYGIGIGRQEHPDEWTLDGRLQVPEKAYLLAGSYPINGTATNSEGETTADFINIEYPGYYEITRTQTDDEVVIALVGNIDSHTIRLTSDNKS